MQRILKYTVAVPDASDGITEVELPRGARILSAGAQGPLLVIWALVDHVQANYERRPVRVLGTGHYFGEQELDGYDFVGTVQMPFTPDGYVLPAVSAEQVWHVWAKPSDWSRA